MIIIQQIFRRQRGIQRDNTELKSLSSHLRWLASCYKYHSFWSSGTPDSKSGHLSKGYPLRFRRGRPQRLLKRGVSVGAVDAFGKRARKFRPISPTGPSSIIADSITTAAVRRCSSSFLRHSAKFFSATEASNFTNTARQATGACSMIIRINPSAGPVKSRL